MTPRDQAWQDAIARRRLDIDAERAAKADDEGSKPVDPRRVLLDSLSGLAQQAADEQTHELVDRALAAVSDLAFGADNVQAGSDNDAAGIKQIIEARRGRRG